MNEPEFYQEDRAVLGFENQPIKVLKLANSNYVLINLVDVANIMGKNAFEFLEKEETKKKIKIYENASRRYSDALAEKDVVKIESTEEVYVHPLLAFDITWPGNIELHMWCHDAAFRYHELINNH